MKFFIDTADVKEIQNGVAMGLVDGVTTNPSLIAKSGRKQHDVIREICALCPGPISAEVTSTAYAGMLEEAAPLADIAPNVVIKLPLTPDGLKACRTLTSRGVKTNVTLCFSPLQALAAAKAGATFVSPFIGRLDDVSTDGLGLIEQIVTIYNNYEFSTEVLVASVRHPMHIVESALMGADVVTVPWNVLQNILKHPLTDIGLEKFLADARAAEGRGR